MLAQQNSVQFARRGAREPLTGLQWRKRKDATMADFGRESSPNPSSLLSLSVPAAALLLKRTAANVYRLCKVHQLGHHANGQRTLTPDDLRYLASLRPGNPAWRANGSVAASNGRGPRVAAADQRSAIYAHQAN
jgi:hypothetical protein